MARNRMIKPEIWTSEQFVNCSTTARLLFIGMWNFADDHGIIPAGPLHLKMCILPGDPYTIDEINSFISEIENQKLVARYEVENQQYLIITGWHHQKIEKPHYKYPEPEKEFDDQSTTVRRPIDNHSTQEVKGKERERKKKLKENKELPENIPASQKAYPLCIDIYNEFCKTQIGVGAKIDGAQGNAMKSIIAYLNKEVKIKPASENDIAHAFEYILQNIKKWDPFLQNKIKLTEINSNLINIIKNIKNGTSKGTNKGVTEDEFRSFIAEHATDNPEQ